MQKEACVISVGGSLIVPNSGIDYRYLKSFRSLIMNQVAQRRRFFLVAGGGLTAREYIQAAGKVVRVSDDDRDWLGIHSTRLNAHLLRTIFRGVAHPEIIKNPTIKMDIKKDRIVVAGGWKPGWSSDYVAVMIAKEYGIKTVINLSNIDYAYDKDPNVFSDAKKIENISWQEFRKIVGDRWIPGMSAPFDPIASRLAQGIRLKVIIANGKKLANLRDCLEKRKFKGTIIEGD